MEIYYYPVLESEMKVITDACAVKYVKETGKFTIDYNEFTQQIVLLPEQIELIQPYN